MQPLTTGLMAWFPATYLHPYDIETAATTTSTGMDAGVGLVLMITGLFLYSGCLCIRDRWWE